MSLECSVLYDGKDKLSYLPSVPPGDMAIFRDFSDGHEKIIGLGCSISDLGGMVYEIHDEETIALANEKGTAKELFRDEHRVEFIFPDSDYYRTIIKKSGRIVILAAKHNLPFTLSLN